MCIDKEIVPVKPYTVKELADLYGASAKTLRTLLWPHQDAIGKRGEPLLYFTVGENNL
jgi:hypothetical protein